MAIDAAMHHQHHLILAGGGHSHALVLRRWIMNPSCRPEGLVTLINRNSTSLYSGMVPGLIAGEYELDEISLDLRRLSNEAGVAFVMAEIVGLNLSNQTLLLRNRPEIHFDQLSLDVGGETPPARVGMPIKPLEPALQWINNQDDLNEQHESIDLIGAGLSGVETALALRRRWPNRTIQLKAKQGSIRTWMQHALRHESIHLIEENISESKTSTTNTYCLRCTGSQAPGWIADSGLHCDADQRVLTLDTLQVIGYPNIFASGDCAVIKASPRPASGVWAVRAAQPLAHNLKAAAEGQRLSHWQPQNKALQLVGGRETAWAIWGKQVIGPHPWLWHWKRRIDQTFMAKFSKTKTMTNKQHHQTMACRGCAAKLEATSLKAALRQAGLSKLASQPEDAAEIHHDADRKTNDESTKPTPRYFQSVDGFPALVSDAWLNGRLTALHACSDLWACGAEVNSVQTLITLPKLSKQLKQSLLAQTLAGIQSTLIPQGATLIGGHTLEDRYLPRDHPASLGLQVSLTVNGTLQREAKALSKAGLQPGDRLLLSRSLGTGVLFAASMLGSTTPREIDQALSQMATSQHPLVSQLHNFPIHACTDITGFGLLGHLGEMLISSNNIRILSKKTQLSLVLDIEDIPTLPGALPLLQSGHESSLAAGNRKSWGLLNNNDETGSPLVELSLTTIKQGTDEYQAFLELLIDPQTCGPLLISCDSDTAERLIAEGPWHPIGHVRHRQENSYATHSLSSK